MSAQKKPTFNEVKSIAEQRKAIAYELAYEQLPHVLRSKKDSAQKASISFQSLEMRALKELRK